MRLFGAYAENKNVSRFAVRSVAEDTVFADTDDGYEFFCSVGSAVGQGDTTRHTSCNDLFTCKNIIDTDLSISKFMFLVEDAHHLFDDVFFVLSVEENDTVRCEDLFHFDAAVDGIDMPIDSDMNCYATELVKPITYDMVKIEYDGTAAAGRYFRVEGGSSNAFSLSFDKANVALYISTSGFQLLERENFTFHALQEEFAMPEMIRCYNDITPEGYSNYIFEFYIPEGVAKANNGAYSIDFNAEGFTVDSMVAEGFYELINANEETPKDEDDTWLDGVHDWGVQAGEDVSAWLKDNTGIAISGGGVIVLFVIGLLIFSIRGRRRRK